MQQFLPIFSLFFSCIGEIGTSGRDRRLPHNMYWSSPAAVCPCPDALRAVYLLGNLISHGKTSRGGCTWKNRSRVATNMLKTEQQLAWRMPPKVALATLPPATPQTPAQRYSRRYRYRYSTAIVLPSTWSQTISKHKWWQSVSILSPHPLPLRSNHSQPPPSAPTPGNSQRLCTMLAKFILLMPVYLHATMSPP